MLSMSDVELRIESASDIISGALNRNKPLLICGNGGSASDSNHIAGELVGRFLLSRKALNVISLSANSAIITAWGNDVNFETIYSRQVEAHGQSEGVLLGISTSGNSANVVSAMKAAKEKGMVTVGLTGNGGGAITKYTDFLIDAPSSLTPRIQEMHLIIYHYICERIELKLQ